MDEYLIDELGAYNTRVSEGIQHTKEYTKKMKKLQKQFDLEYRRKVG